MVDSCNHNKTSLIHQELSPLQTWASLECFLAIPGCGKQLLTSYNSSSECGGVNGPSDDQRAVILRLPRTSLPGEDWLMESRDSTATRSCWLRQLPRQVPPLSTTSVYKEYTDKCMRFLSHRGLSTVRSILHCLRICSNTAELAITNRH